MFDKSYFDKEFPKHLDHFKKMLKQDARVTFVMGDNHHIVLNKIEELKDGWFSFWIHDSDYTSEHKTSVLMISRYDQIRQILLYPSKGELSVGFRSK